MQRHLPQGLGVRCRRRPVGSPTSRLLLDREDCDGLALDTEGNVWITGFRSPGVLHRVKPDGTVLPDVATPTGATTQVRFGGKDGRDYFIVVCPEDAGDSLKEGQARWRAPRCLYQAAAREVPGVLMRACRGSSWAEGGET